MSGFFFWVGDFVPRFILFFWVLRECGDCGLHGVATEDPGEELVCRFWDLILKCARSREAL